jgi:hypothetical protein
VFSVLAACAVETKPPYVKNGKEYGVTRGFVWRPTWWNYYERGVSYAEGEYWEDAVEDLIEAIQMRDKDQRRARTYGMHFIDYFPHRELGIVYYRQERYPEAIEELEESLATEESAKAEYFLNRARKARLESTGADRRPPAIEVTYPTEGLLTRDMSLTIQGVASDDQYVFGIEVNGKTIPIFLARKEIPFSMRVALNPGMNKVEVVARDLLGRETRKEILVQVDRAGPVLFLEPMEIVTGPEEATYRVSGEVRDGIGISSVMIDGIPVKGILGRSYRFEQTLTVLSDREVVEVVAEDLVGNITHGHVAAPKEGAVRGREHTKIAWLGESLSDVSSVFASPSGVDCGESAGSLLSGPWARLDVAAGTDQKDPNLSRSGPLIHMKDLPDVLTVYYESLYLEGSVTGPIPIQGIQVNGNQLLDRAGRDIFFSYLVGLDEGNNSIQIQAHDLEGRETSRVLSVFRKIPEILSLEERMHLSLIPFPSDSCSVERARLITEDLLVALTQQGRFHMVERERLADILNELKLASSKLVQDKNAVRVGRILAADGTILGGVFETPRAFEVVARVVDTETTQVMVTKDVFSEDKSLESIRTMMKGLAYKLRQGLPLLEGTVLRCEDDCFYLNLGKKTGILPEQRFLIFREGSEIRHPTTDIYLGREIEILAEGRIQEIFDEMASARITRRRGVDEPVHPSDQIITK